MDVKKLNMLGLAQRAGKVISGEELVEKAIMQKKAKVVFVASDSSDATKDKFDKKCFFYKIPTIFDYNSSQLSHAIGKTRKIICITDINFANAFKKEV